MSATSECQITRLIKDTSIMERTDFWLPLSDRGRSDRIPYELIQLLVAFA